jgi:hypothetical protein
MHSTAVFLSWMKFSTALIRSQFSSLRLREFNLHKMSYNQGKDAGMQVPLTSPRSREVLRIAKVHAAQPQSTDLLLADSHSVSQVIRMQPGTTAIQEGSTSSETTVTAEATVSSKCICWYFYYLPLRIIN